MKVPTRRWGNVSTCASTSVSHFLASMKVPTRRWGNNVSHLWKTPFCPASMKVPTRRWGNASDGSVEKGAVP